MRYQPFLISFFLVFFISFAISASGQNVTIKGTAKGAEGKLIILKSYSDYFTMNEQYLAKSIIDSSGNFTISCYIPSATTVVVHIEYYSGEMYLEQNKTYTIEIKNLVFNAKFDKVNHNLNPFNCYIKVLSNDKDELNKLTQKLNIMYNTFIRDNIFILKKKEILSKVDTFLIAVNDTFAETKNPFFNDYLKYRMASLKLLTNYSDSYILMLDYLYNKPILYDNIEYFSFIKNYFDDYFSNLTHPILVSDFYMPVNTNRNLSELLDMLGKDTLFVNEKLREVIMLNTLNTLYASNDFSKKNILEILKTFSVTSKFEIHKRIARSMISYLTRFDKGSPAPDFELKSTNNVNVKLSDFRGKYVYLNFYASWCLNCKDEMELMKKLRQNFDNDVVFISISVDREFMTTYHFAREQKYNWMFLHLNSDYDLLESYAVYAYPDFVLIDKSGNFIQCPAMKPSDNIELYLTNLLKAGKDNPNEKN